VEREPRWRRKKRGDHLQAVRVELSAGRIAAARPEDWITERACQRAPDEHHWSARSAHQAPLDRSSVPRAHVECPAGSSITRQSLRCIRRERSHRKNREEEQSGERRATWAHGNQALFAAATSTKTSTRSGLTERILADAGDAVDAQSRRPDAKYEVAQQVRVAVGIA
jgi:hypothetical protein